MTTKTFYGIRIASTGQLARIEVYGCYGHARLTDDENDPVWEVESPALVARALADNPIVENSSYEHPRWGRFKREEMEPVIVHVRTEVSRIPIVEPVRFDTTIDARDLTQALAERYAGKKLPDQRYVLVIGYLEGKTREDVQALTGKIVMFGDIWNVRRVVAVADPPADFPTNFRDRTGILLICSDAPRGDVFDLRTHLE